MNISDIESIPVKTLDSLKADGWTVQGLSQASPDDLTGYDRIGESTAEKIIAEAGKVLALNKAETWLIRSLSSTPLVVPEVITIDGDSYALSQSYKFPQGGELPVIREDAEILLMVETKTKGCCNSDAKPTSLFARVG